MPAFMRSGATRAERTADEVLRRAGLENATAGEVKAAQRDTAQNNKATTTETRIVTEVEEEATDGLYRRPGPLQVTRALPKKSHGSYGFTTYSFLLCYATVDNYRGFVQDLQKLFLCQVGFPLQLKPPLFFGLFSA